MGSEGDSRSRPWAAPHPHASRWDSRDNRSSYDYGYDSAAQPHHHHAGPSSSSSSASHWNSNHHGSAYDKGYRRPSRGGAPRGGDPRRSRSPPSRPPRREYPGSDAHVQSAGGSTGDPRLNRGYTADPRRRPRDVEEGEIATTREATAEPRRPASAVVQPNTSRNGGAAPAQLGPLPSGSNGQTPVAAPPAAGSVTAAHLSSLFENVENRMGGLSSLAEQASGRLPSSSETAQQVYTSLKARQDHLDRAKQAADLIQDSETWLKLHPDKGPDRSSWQTEGRPKLEKEIVESRQAAEEAGSGLIKGLQKLVDFGPACGLAVATSARHNLEMAEAMQAEYRGAFRKLNSDLADVKVAQETQAGQMARAAQQAARTSAPAPAPAATSASASTSSTPATAAPTPAERTRSPGAEERLRERGREAHALLRRRVALIEEQLEEMREAQAGQGSEVEDNLPGNIRHALREEIDLRQKKRKLLSTGPDKVRGSEGETSLRSSLPPNFGGAHAMREQPIRETLAAEAARAPTATDAAQSTALELSRPAHDDRPVPEPETAAPRAVATPQTHDVQTSDLVRKDDLTRAFETATAAGEARLNRALAKLGEELAPKVEQAGKEKVVKLEENIRVAFSNVEREFCKLRDERKESLDMLGKELERIDAHFVAAAKTAQAERQFLYEEVKRLSTDQMEQQKNFRAVVEAVMQLGRQFHLVRPASTTPARPLQLPGDASISRSQQPVPVYTNAAQPQTAGSGPALLTAEQNNALARCLSASDVTPTPSANIGTSTVNGALPSTNGHRDHQQEQPSDLARAQQQHQQAQQAQTQVQAQQVRPQTPTQPGPSPSHAPVQ
ncbi:unnamed protein product [Parajaminaea phylloscopi]